jgi:antitoxin CptB
VVVRADDSTDDGADDSADDSADAVAMRRLSWRMRRGMLENDLLLRRALGGGADGAPPMLPAAERAALDRLLELPDGVLLDVLVGRASPEPAEDGGAMAGLLVRLRSA